MANNFRKDFSRSSSTIWLNAASEGPLPNIAAKQLQSAIDWKSNPHQLTLDKFINVPKELKKSIGKLLGLNYQDVILGNSASYGLHLLANGISFKKNDEIILMQDDFPSNILPWLALTEQGVKVKQVKPHDRVLSPDELLSNISAKTRVVCISHVHTFTGCAIDLPQFAKICKKHNILFILNISQSVGTMPLKFSKLSVDAIVSAGYKWLCGPYGTGFCWIKPELRKDLKFNQAYWASLMTAEMLEKQDKLLPIKSMSAKKYDIFATANFFNLVPFKAAIDYFLTIGIKNVQSYQQELIDYFIKKIDRNYYRLISAEDRSRRSGLCVFSHLDQKRNKQIHQTLLDHKIYTAFWKGNIRISAHVYNTKREISALLAILKQFQE